MSGTAATLTLHNREIFERNVTRGLVAGAAAGTLHFLANKLGVMLGSLLGFTAMPFPAPDQVHVLPLTYAAIAATAVALARGDKLDRLLLIALGVVLPAIPWALGISFGWTVALSGAAAGALMVRSHLSEVGEEGAVAAGRPGPLNYAMGALFTSGLAVAGVAVARSLGSWLLDASMPSLLLALFGGVVLSLFSAIGSIGGHLALKPDPVEARCEEVIPRLTGELKSLATRALGLYQQCGKTLQELPREPAREEMARTLSRMTREAVDLAAEWSGLEAQLQSSAAHDLAAQLDDLVKSAEKTKDAVAKRQLEMGAQALREEMEHLAELQIQRERIVAKLKAEVALLERARVALLGMRSGQMSIKAAELSALARRFNSLSSLTTAEARMADAVATSAELAQHEVDAAVTAVDAGAAGDPLPPSPGPKVGA
jgi:hypothetical protein